MMDENRIELRKFGLEWEFCGGRDGSHHAIDLYDLSVALRGLHRSWAIVGNFILTRQIVTRVPNIKNVEVLAHPAEEGSYKFIVSIGMISTLLYSLGTAPIDTPIGNITWSLYDIIIQNILGIRADPERSVFYQYYDDKDNWKNKIDSLSQKIEPSIIDMHRPIFTGSISHTTLGMVDSMDKNSMNFDQNTWEAINFSMVSQKTYEFEGRVSQYNVNTKTGMIFIASEKRAIPFVLDKNIIIESTVFSESLLLYDEIKNDKDRRGFFRLFGKKVKGRHGLLKKIIITNVYPSSLIKINE